MEELIGGTLSLAAIAGIVLFLSVPVIAISSMVIASHLGKLVNAIHLAIYKKDGDQEDE